MSNVEMLRWYDKDLWTVSDLNLTTCKCRKCSDLDLLELLEEEEIDTDGLD